MDETKIVKLLKGYEMPCVSGEYEFIHQKDYQAIAKELLVAIAVTHCCKSDSEQLPKSLSNKAYKCANKMTC